MAEHRDLTTSERKFVARVAPRVKNDELLDDLVGLTEDEARAISSWASCVRVIGRDGKMVGYDWDWNLQRVNLVIGGDKVLWAARF